MRPTPLISDLARRASLIQVNGSCITDHPGDANIIALREVSAPTGLPRMSKAPLHFTNACSYKPVVGIDVGDPYRETDQAATPSRIVTLTPRTPGSNAQPSETEITSHTPLLGASVDQDLRPMPLNQLQFQLHRRSIHVSLATKQTRTCQR